jgi:hypothetical protein
MRTAVDRFGFIGLRDRNGVEIRGGDQVHVRMWNGDEFTAAVNYSPAHACWCIGERAIINIGRDKGTTLEVIEALLPESKPLSKRRKGTPT